MRIFFGKFVSDRATENPQPEYGSVFEMNKYQEMLVLIKWLAAISLN